MCNCTLDNLIEDKICSFGKCTQGTLDKSDKVMECKASIPLVQSVGPIELYREEEKKSLNLEEK
jgi:hypothetical protein